MNLLPLALVSLGSLAFFGAEAAPTLDLAADFKRKWSRWALRRVRRDAALRLAEATTPPPLVLAEELTGGQPSHHLRLKRQDPLTIFHTHLRVSCKMGTCSVANLADQIYHLNNKEKDANAPSRKISPHGYGRRRRALRKTPRGSHSRPHQLLGEA